MSGALIKKGILGLGRVSTIYYFNEIQRRYQLQHDEFSTCELLLYQIDFQEINPFLPDDFENLIPKIESCFTQVFKMEISRLLVPNITLHETLDKINLPFQIYHPIDLTLNYLTEKDISEIYIFGTLYTMNGTYISEKFAKKAVKILKPTAADQIWIDTFREAVYNETQTAAEVLYFHQLIQKYSQKSPVLLACTELCVFSPKDNPACIDMAELQIEAFVK